MRHGTAFEDVPLDRDRTSKLFKAEYPMFISTWSFTPESVARQAK